MTEWKLKRDEQEYPATLDNLREWARIGRIAATDYVFNPTLGRWMFASETPELAGMITTPATTRQSAATHALQIALVLFLFVLMFGLWGASSLAVLCGIGTLLFVVIALIAHVVAR